MEINQTSKANEEIDLKKLFVNILLSWRVIIIICVISAFLCSVLALYMVYEKKSNIIEQVNDTENIDFSNYTEVEIDTYLRKQELNENEIENINNSLKSLKDYKQIYKSYSDYLENSVFMKADTLNVSEVKVTINTNDSILKENILETYKSSLKSDSYIEYIKDSMNLQIDSKYLSEMINLDLENDLLDLKTNYYLTIVIYSVDKEFSTKITNLTIDWLNLESGKLNEEFGDFELLIIGNSNNKVINSKYLETKIDLYNKMTNISEQTKSIPTSLSENEKKYYDKIYSSLYNEDSSDIEEIVTNSPSNIIYMLKYGLVGFAIGIMISVILVFINIKTRNVLESDTDLTDKYGLCILGGILRHELRNKNIIDKTLQKMLQSNVLFLSSLNNNRDLLAISIKNVLIKRNCKDLLLIGNIENEVQDYLVELKNRLAEDNINMKMVPSFINNSECKEILENAEGIVLLETIGESSYHQIETELFILKIQEAKILGAIVVY